MSKDKSPDTFNVSKINKSEYGKFQCLGCGKEGLRFKDNLCHKCKRKMNSPSKEFERKTVETPKEDTFNLSDRIFIAHSELWYKPKDVREFIKKVKEKIKNYRTATYNYKILHELEREIDKLAGEKLIVKEEQDYDQNIERK